MLACLPGIQDAQLVLCGKTQEILAFYDRWAVSKCWAGRSNWENSPFLEIAALQLLSNSEGPLCAHLCTQLHWEPSSGLTPWSVFQHYWCRLEVIILSDSLNQRKLTSKHFFSPKLRESDYLNYFDRLVTKRPTLMLSIILISQSNSAKLKQSRLFLFVPSQGGDPWSLLKRYSWKKWCVFIWQTVENQTFGAVLSMFMHQIRIWSIRHF